MNDERGDNDLEKQISDLKMKIKVYESGLFDIKKLKYEIVELQSEIIKKNNLIEGMKKIIEDLSAK
jgi:chaperonin cofactor prefoldin|tara:strand:- start:119 stop:316 length:198 start_codon:yes stop_codon:yes gene_type:complete